MLIKVSEKRLLKRLVFGFLVVVVAIAELKAQSFSGFAVSLYARMFATERIVLRGHTEQDLASSINNLSRFASVGEIVKTVLRDPRIERVEVSKDWLARQAILTLHDKKPYFALTNTLGFILLSRDGDLISFEAQAPENLVRVDVNFFGDLSQGTELFLRLASRVEKIERELTWSVASISVREAEMVIDFVEHPVTVIFGVESLTGDVARLEMELKRLRVLLKTLDPLKMASLRSVNLAFRKVAVAKFEESQ